MTAVLLLKSLYGVQLGTLPLNVLKAVKPINCPLCDMRFAHKTILQHHRCGNEMDTTSIPKHLSTKELKEQLLKLKLPTNGSKTVLCTRLEQFISTKGLRTFLYLTFKGKGRS